MYIAFFLYIYCKIILCITGGKQISKSVKVFSDLFLLEELKYDYAKHAATLECWSLASFKCILILRLGHKCLVITMKVMFGEGW